MNSFGGIIAKYRKIKHLKQNELCDLLIKEGCIINNKTLSGWETGRAEPSLAQFFTLCRILEIKDIYEAVFGFNPYSIREKLSDEGCAKVEEYIDLLQNSGKYDRIKARIMSIRPEYIRLFAMPVSAGTGNFLDGYDYEEIEKTDDIPRNADFGVKISGDSMLPRYQNGQTIWIEQTEELKDGEIGIFLLDGNAYCKKLQNNKKGTFLISLNPKYDPIPITEYSMLKVFGKVLS